ncbi:MAG: hypothetical protein WD627_06210 [Actinomycetota bacterium]
MTRLKRPLVALLSLCLLAGAACGSSGGDSTHKAAGKDTAEKFRLASANTLNVETMRFSIFFDLQGLGQMGGEGFQDLKSGTMSMTLNMPQFVPGMPPMKMETLMVGETIYMRSDIFSAALPKGKTWMKLDLATLGNELGIDFDAILEQSRNSDPRSQLSFVQGAKGDIKELGTAVIRGAPTTHYKFTVDVAEAVKDLPAELAELKPLLEGVGLGEFPAEAWIDDEGLIRRINYAMSVPVDEGGATQTMSISQDFFDFGAEVDVSAPPAAEVIDFIEALGSLQ